MVLNMESNRNYHFIPNIMGAQLELEHAKDAYMSMPGSMSYWDERCIAARQRIQTAREVLNLCEENAA